MSALEEIRLGDIGTLFKCTIKDNEDIVDVSTATTKLLKLFKPSGSLLTKNASLFTDGTDGIITYTTVSGDLSELGTWQLQGKVEFTEVAQFNSSIEKFKVHRNLS